MSEDNLVPLVYDGSRLLCHRQSSCSLQKYSFSRNNQVCVVETTRSAVGMQAIFPLKSQHKSLGGGSMTVV